MLFQKARRAGVIKIDHCVAVRTGFQHAAGKMDDHVSLIAGCREWLSQAPFCRIGSQHRKAIFSQVSADTTANKTTRTRNSIDHNNTNLLYDMYSILTLYI